jgi:CBS domain-containing protein
MHVGAECIGEDDTLLTAAQKMRDLDVGALPICGRDNRLHGIITDRDVVIRCCAEGRNPANVQAGEFAQEGLHWVESNTDINDVLRKMEQHQVKRMPVIEDHRLVGMISEADLGRHLSEDQVAHFVEGVYAASTRRATGRGGAR